MSQHVRMLRHAGLVRLRGLGTTQLNALSRAEIDAAFPGLSAAVPGGSADAGG